MITLPPGPDELLEEVPLGHEDIAKEYAQNEWEYAEKQGQQRAQNKNSRWKSPFMKMI